MKENTTSKKLGSSGFTLIELMMTVAIAAVLVTIAYASYSSQIRKSRRTEAKTALMDLAGREERLYSTTNAYSSTFSDLGYTGSVIGNGYYQAQISNVTAGPPATFTLTATPVAGTSQASDTECQSFVVDQTGVQSSTGTSTTCW
jgi:type IV pilus assembly protein PilE